MTDELVDALDRIVLSQEIPTRRWIISSVSRLEPGDRCFVTMANIRTAFPDLSNDTPGLIRQFKAMADGFGLVVEYDFHQDGFHFVSPAPRKRIILTPNRSQA